MLEWTRKTIRPMTGGMVTSRPGKDLMDIEYQMLKNWLFRDGLWHKRPGLEPLYNSGSGGAIGGPVVGLFRHYRSDGDKYSIAIDLDDNNTTARLLGKVNDTIGTVDWTVIDATWLDYDGGNLLPDYFRSASFGEKLILTDGVHDVQYFEKKDGDDWLKGRLGALPPKRQINPYNPDLVVGSVSCSEWKGNPIFPGGFAQYCYVYLYEDESGKVSYSNPSPHSPIIALDWMGKGMNGYKDLRSIREPGGIEGAEPVEGVGPVDVGPTRINLTDLGIGAEYMSSATDIETVKRIIRRDIYRRTKTFADQGFGTWQKVGESNIKDGVGGEGFLDQDHNLSLMPLSMDKNPPPRGKNVINHKNHVIFGNYLDDVIEAPPNQGDTSYPYYENFGLSKRARLSIVNKTQRGFTDATIRFRLQWHDDTAPDYINFTENAIDPEHNILFSDGDGKTLLPFYREGYKRSGFLKYENIDPPASTFAVGDWITSGGAEALITKVDAGNAKLWIEKMTAHAFAVSDTIDNGDGVTADLTVVEFQEAIFVVRVPEILTEGSAFIYVFYNATNSISDPVSDWNEVYHRKYASGDMISLYNINLDYPMPSYDNTPVDRIGLINCHRTVGRRGVEPSEFAPPYGNDTTTENNEGEYSMNLSGGVPRYFGMRDKSLEVEKGTLAFFIKTVGVYMNENSYRISYGGGLEINYSHVGNHIYIALGDDFAVQLGHNFSLNKWYFFSISWDSTGGGSPHIYVREIGSNPGGEEFHDSGLGIYPENVQGGNISFGDARQYDPQIRNNTGMSFIAEPALYNRVLSYEEVEQAFHRRDLDSWYYDVENSRATPGDWNNASATCNIKVSDVEDVGEDGDTHMAGIAISDAGNPHTYKATNRRVIGEDSDALTGMLEFMGHVLMYKHNSVYRFRTDGPMTQWMEEDAPVDEALKIGCVAPMTLCRGSIHGGDVAIGLADTGLYAFDGGDFIELSQPIADQLRALTAVQKKTAIGFYWAKYRVYVLGVGSTARTGWTKLDKGTIGDNISDTVYMFHLDTLAVKMLENGEREVKINISKHTTKLTGDKFYLGYPCAWYGRGDDGEILFGHGNSARIYVWGERTGDDEYLDDWEGSDLAVPIEIKTRCFWSRSALFRGFKPFYKGRKLVGASMEWVKNILTASVKTFDELAFDNATQGETTHSSYSNVLSGGHNGGKLYLLPRAARGEWMEIKFTEDSAEGDIIWEGLEFEYMELPNP